MVSRCGCSDALVPARGRSELGVPQSEAIPLAEELPMSSPSLTKSSFARRFTDAYARGLASRQGRDNIDLARFPELRYPPLRARIRDLVDTTLHRLKLARRGAAGRSQHRLVEVLERFTGLEALDATLADDRSRQILVELLAYRVLGAKHVRLSRNTEAYRRLPSELHGKGVVGGVSRFVSSMTGQPLQVVDLAPLGRNLRFHGGVGAVRTQFVIQQYRLERDGVRLTVEPGDVVIDGGACYGETALHFADDAGPAGRVLTFEFIPPNLEVLEANLALNPTLSDRIELVQHPLWDTVGEEMRFLIDGPGSRVANASDSLPTVSVTTETIDHVLSQRGIDRVDFIKLDIEGAELRALKGAESAIRRHRPKLAVCLYHHLDDFVEIPAWLRSLDLGYRFYIDHFTIHAEETILFAVPPDRDGVA